MSSIAPKRPLLDDNELWAAPAREWLARRLPIKSVLALVCVIRAKTEALDRLSKRPRDALRARQSIEVGACASACASAMGVDSPTTTKPNALQLVLDRRFISIGSKTVAES
jgi:hypothetical protein